MNSNKKEIVKEILIGIGLVGGILFVGALAPNIFKMLGKSNLGRRRFTKEQVENATYYLKRRKMIISKENPDGTIMVELSEKGKKKVVFYDLDKMKIKPMKKWDGKWRFVMFDIPHRLRNASNALRDKLKELGFYQFQKSIWIHPYPIENEIDFISQIFEIRRFVKMGEMVNLEGDEKIKSEFKLQ